MKLFYLISSLLLCSLAGWAFAALTITSTPDGIPVLYAKQAKECEEGGGCAIFSQREFEKAVYIILARQRRAGPDA